MSGLQEGLPSFDFAAGALPIWLIAGAVAALVVAAIALAVTRRGMGATAFWRVAGVVIGALLVWLAADRWSAHEQALAKRALEARAAELTARALAPGSALACIDGTASASVEAACEKSLFASPEAIAAALSYADARLSLLADGAALAARDPALIPSLERTRRAVEADRFGIIAQVLMMRGCDASQCPVFKLVADPARLVANLDSRAFESNVVLHSGAWRSDQPAVAAAPAVAPPGATAAAAPLATAAPAATPSVTNTPASTGATGVPVASKYDFPSAASIPAVSIMDAEPAPARPAAENAAPAPTSPPTPRARPQSSRRQQSAREPAPAPLPPPPPPTAIVPPAATTPAAPAGASLR